VANIKSQIKRITTNEKARLRNKSVKSELKTHIRRVREAVAGGDKDAASVISRMRSSPRVSFTAWSTRSLRAWLRYEATPLRSLPNSPWSRRRRPCCSG
jgi:hypothetical protein